MIIFIISITFLRLNGSFISGLKKVSPYLYHENKNKSNFIFSLIDQTTIRKRIKSIVVTIFLFSTAYQAKAQTIEMGLNLGLIGKRYTVSQNYLGNSSFVRQGEVNYGTRVGMQASLNSLPERYKPRNYRLDHGLMLEIAASNGGGNIDFIEMQPDDSFLTAKLNYRTWQGELNILYQAKIDNFQLLMGPSFTYHTYRGVRNNLKSSTEFVFTQKQINDYYVGIDFGIGYRYEKLLIATRYHTNIKAFGEETKSIPIAYNNHQARLIISYFLYKKKLRKKYRGLYI